MGYANRLMRLAFPDLSEDGDEIFVTILNPKTVTLAKLSPREVAMGPDGEPLAGEAMLATYEAMSNLVYDWKVYDADDLGDDPAPLPLPATPELVAKLPLDIINAIGEKMREATASPQ